MTNLKRLLSLGVFLASTLTLNAQSTTAAYFWGNAAQDLLGFSCSDAGDVNGDGVLDYMFSAPQDDFNGTDAGAVWVFSGFDNSLIHGLSGANAGDNFGWSVSGVGDLNGDGFAEFIVGAPKEDFNGTDSGTVYVFSGVDATILYIYDGSAAGDEFGRSVSDAGDVTGDGVPDFLVGAPFEDALATDGGTVYVFSGFDGTNTVFYDGGAANDHFGAAVGRAGDVDGDGSSDIIIGAPNDDFSGTDAGGVWIYSGSTGSVIYSYSGVNPGDHLGHSISGIGDIDRDGFADFIMGAPDNDFSATNAGVAYVFSGMANTYLYGYSGAGAGDNFGWSVAQAGDYNGDGFDDFLIGAPLEDVNGNADAGAADLYSGLDGSFLDGYIGNAADNRLGYSLSGLGDMTGDGFHDYIITYPYWDAVNTNDGGCSIIHAETLPTLNYGGKLGNTLFLDWTPDASDPFSVTGTVTCVGATPGGAGLAGVSLAPANTTIFGFQLLVANDGMNLLSSDAFGYDFGGTVTIPMVTRQQAFLAGSNVFIQFFETSPLIQASNGLALLLVP